MSRLTALHSKSTVSGRRRTLILLLWETADAMLDELVERLAAAGYTDVRPTDSRVFGNLDPGGTRLIELAARARMTHQSMSELVASLETRGYLERQPDPADRRARLIRLTGLGRSLQRLALREIADIESTWLRWMGRGTGANLQAALLRALDAHLQARPGRPVSAAPSQVSTTKAEAMSSSAVHS
jgi:DNA-binding MarR family transcriptional regulator